MATAQMDAAPTVEIVCLQKGSDSAPLYCMPTIAGSLRAYDDLVKEIGADRPVYGIRIGRAQTDSEAFESLPEMAASMAAKLLLHQRAGPICLIGYSFGGYLAIELARQLGEKGRRVPFVGIVDQMPPAASFSLPYRMCFFTMNIGPWVLTTARGVLTDAKQLLDSRHGVLRRLRRQHHVHTQDWYQGLPENRKDVVNQNLAIRRTYRFSGTYRGTIFLFRQSPSGPSFDHLFRPQRLEDFGWQRLTGANVRVVYIAGDHASCMSHPHVVHMADELRQALDEALGLIAHNPQAQSSRAH
jgi:thioesterase domain-containing protein